MSAWKLESEKYAALNTLAKQGGTVVFGGRSDVDVPVNELKQSFKLSADLYNRSFSDATLAEAIKLYDEYVAPLAPSTVLLRLGEADVATFDDNPVAFVRAYRETILHIREKNKKCEIAVLTLDNPNSNATIDKMNQALEALAKSERCFFENVDYSRENANSTQDAVSFVYSTGFVSQLGARVPLRNLIKILFGYSTTQIPSVSNEKRKSGTSRFVNMTTASIF